VLGEWPTVEKKLSTIVHDPNVDPTIHQSPEAVDHVQRVFHNEMAEVMGEAGIMTWEVPFDRAAIRANGADMVAFTAVAREGHNHGRDHPLCFHIHRYITCDNFSVRRVVERIEGDMEVTLMRALAAAARAFAEEIERDLPVDEADRSSNVPVAGSPRSMLEVLRSVAEINDGLGRGANDEEMRQIARQAGMDPRGMAGYYAASLLEKHEDGSRWLGGEGRGRLDRLVALVGVHPLGAERDRSPEALAGAGA
jgi:hypothetical protein